jgi:ribosomal protein L16 Arg81 hydroxylase
VSPPTEPHFFPALARLLEPLGTVSFFRDHWEKSAVRVTDQSAGRAFLKEADWKSLVETALARSAQVEVIREGVPGKTMLQDEVVKGFNEGASIRVIRIEVASPQLMELCSSLTDEFGFRISANLYVTPAHERGLRTHVDDHDVLVVQMAGRKKWELFGTPYALPIEFKAPFIFEMKGETQRNGAFGARGFEGSEPPRTDEFILNAGEVLYVPRGEVHRAASLDEPSVHVTIGIHATTWADFIAFLVGHAARTNQGLRETLPPGLHRFQPAKGWIGAEVKARSSDLMNLFDPGAGLEEMSARFAAWRGADQVVDASRAFDPTARYRLSSATAVRRSDDAIQLHSLLKGGGCETLPSAFNPAVNLLLQEGVTAASTPGMTERSAAVFLKTLFAKGLLSPA